MKLKFRYYDKVVKCFCHSDEFGFEDNFEKLSYFFAKAKLYAEGSVEQWTGLIDSKGHEIYEGDIVKIPISEDGTYVMRKIIFKDGCFVIDETFNPLYVFCNKIFKIEIIGNIYQNPELLIKS